MDNMKEAIQKKYGEAARQARRGAQAGCGCETSCCADPITSNLYDETQATAIPAEAMLASLGCGNPTALADLKPGDVVLDLGSGGGIDVLLSARRVGPTGKAYGLDMTGEMLALARDNQEKSGLTNVEFLPYQPMERLAESLSTADLGVVCLGKEFTGMSVPSKTYGLMAAAIPILAFVDEVSEIGLMLIVFTPVPYVDATSSYRFPSKWARAAVAAAGIGAELLVGAIAVYVWLLAEPDLVTAVAFNVLLIAGVSTLLVNGNPLMRYDGYFVLCDLLEASLATSDATRRRLLDALLAEALVPAAPPALKLAG